MTIIVLVNYQILWDLVNVSIEEKSLYHKNNLGIKTEMSDNN